MTSTRAHSCMIQQADCGRISEEPICPKCGLDERMRYIDEEAAILAKSQAQARYWQSHAEGLQAKLNEALEFREAPQTVVLPIGSSYLRGTAPYNESGAIAADKSSFFAPEMIKVPAGTFLMGLKENDPESGGFECPQHQVNIAYLFEIGKFPVTFAQWDACLLEGGVEYRPSDEGWGRGDRPVINVSWNDAHHFIHWLNDRAGFEQDDLFRYRLLSEAEWEYACAAGTRGYFNTHSGKLTAEDANFDTSKTFDGVSLSGQAMLGKTTPVGMFPCNAWGIHDMHGNVCEWVQDCAEENYIGAPTDGSAWETVATSRSLRGGSWYEAGNSCTTTGRWSFRPDTRSKDIGFRLARTIGPNYPRQTVKLKTSHLVDATFTPQMAWPFPTSSQE